MAMKLSAVLGENKSNTSSNTISDFYLVIGQEVLNEEEDTIDLVVLPQPVYLDTMRKKQVSGEGKFQELLLQGNDMLDALLEFGKENLEPGEFKDIDLKVRLYRRKPNQNDKHIKKTFTFCKEQEKIMSDIWYEEEIVESYKNTDPYETGDGHDYE